MEAKWQCYSSFTVRKIAWLLCVKCKTSINAIIILVYSRHLLWRKTPATSDRSYCKPLKCLQVSKRRYLIWCHGNLRKSISCYSSHEIENMVWTFCDQKITRKFTKLKHMQTILILTVNTIRMRLITLQRLLSSIFMWCHVQRLLCTQNTVRERVTIVCVQGDICTLLHNIWTQEV